MAVFLAVTIHWTIIDVKFSDAMISMKCNKRRSITVLSIIQDPLYSGGNMIIIIDNSKNLPIVSCLTTFILTPVDLSSCTFRICFLCFILLFWNHVFTWVSLRLKAFANSTLSGVDRYR